jgi:hypothetical protein
MMEQVGQIQQIYGTTAREVAFKQVLVHANSSFSFWRTLIQEQEHQILQPKNSQEHFYQLKLNNKLI